MKFNSSKARGSNVDPHVLRKGWPRKKQEFKSVALSKRRKAESTVTPTFICKTIELIL